MFRSRASFWAYRVYLINKYCAWSIKSGLKYRNFHKLLMILVTTLIPQLSFCPAGYIKMHSRILLPWKLTIWTLISLLWEQSDLGSYCLQYRLSHYICRRWESRWQKILLEHKILPEIIFFGIFCFWHFFCLIWFFPSSSTIFQLCPDRSSWADPVLSKDSCPSVYSLARSICTSKTCLLKHLDNQINTNISWAGTIKINIGIKHVFLCINIC